MNCKEISECLKQDIYNLVNIARTYAPDQQVQDEITVVENCIHAGLIDYELAWRAEVKQVADNIQEEMREE